MNKSSVDEIRRRFDADVERFSNLQTGQSATMDAPAVLELIARCSAAVNPEAESLLDIGCGAGNYTLKLMERLKLKRVTLVDLSQPMLDRAKQRIHAVDAKMEISILRGDVRDIDLGSEKFDVTVAAAVLHHLRTDAEWKNVFSKLYQSATAGGSLWVSDLVEHQNPGVRDVIWQRFGEYLEQLKGPAYREDVFAYIQKEDTPRSLLYQIDLLRQVGFAQVEILHANACFAAYVGIK